MDVILISFAICLLGVMVTVLLFAVAMRPKDEGEAVAPPKKPATSPEGFFMEEETDPPSEPEAPTNSLLSKLERHIRMEHKAAETFLEGPSVDTLHARPNPLPWH